MIKNNPAILFASGIVLLLVLAGAFGASANGKAGIVRFEAGNSTKNCKNGTSIGSTCGIAIDPSYPLLEDVKKNCTTNGSIGSTCGVPVDPGYPSI